MKNPTIVTAVGVATRSNSAGLGKAIEAAMLDAARKCSEFDPPVTDPAKIREAILAARERVKKEFVAKRDED